MQIFPIIIFGIFFFSINSEIIGFPDNVNSYRIETKHGFINLEINSYKTENSETNINNLFLIGIKNLSLYSPPDMKDISISINGDTIQFTIYDNNLHKLNPLLCELFYQTQYIDKKIYTIENKARNVPYKYFGGAPNKIIEDYKKENNIFQFKINNEIPSLYLLRGREGEKEEDFERIEFNPLDRLEFNEGFEKNCAASMLEEYRDLFWEFDIIKYRFRDQIKDITITFRNKKSEEKPKGSFEDMFYDYPCRNLVLGSKFLDLINVREFNLETGDVILFTNNNEIIKNQLF